MTWNMARAVGLALLTFSLVLMTLWVAARAGHVPAAPSSGGSYSLYG